METVVLQPLFHRGQQCIGICFPRNDLLQNLVQKQAGAKWSQSHKCWYMTCTKENYSLLIKALSGKAILQTGELKRFLTEKKNSNPLPNTGDEQEAVLPNERKKMYPPAGYLHTLSAENREALRQFGQELVLKGYSASTIRTYTNEFTQFLNMIQYVPATGFSVSRLKDYLQYCHTKLHLSENTLHSRINTS